MNDYSFMIYFTYFTKDIILKYLLGEGGLGMSIVQLKENDWLQKNKIMAAGFLIASGLGLLAQLVQRSNQAIILSVAIPFVLAGLFYVISLRVKAISRALPYVLLLLNFIIALGVIFLSGANLGSIGIII